MVCFLWFLFLYLPSQVTCMLKNYIIFCDQLVRTDNSRKLIKVKSTRTNLLAVSLVIMLIAVHTYLILKLKLEATLLDIFFNFLYAQLRMFSLGVTHAHRDFLFFFNFVKHDQPIQPRPISTLRSFIVTQRITREFLK